MEETVFAESSHAVIRSLTKLIVFSKGNSGFSSFAKSSRDSCSQVHPPTSVVMYTDRCIEFPKAKLFLAKVLLRTSNLGRDLFTC
jgi:hypothetical protein